mgnify:CR=1 FL=1
MTNYQWALMHCGVGIIIGHVKLKRNRMMIIYRHWASKRNNMMCVTFAGVKHHNDKWKIVEGGPIKYNKKGVIRLDIPFKGPEGYRY